jgi:hypothetical protein
MDTLNVIEGISEKLRKEPYHLLTNDYIRIEGIQMRVVICIGLAKAQWIDHSFTAGP